MNDYLKRRNSPSERRHAFRGKRSSVANPPDFQDRLSRVVPKRRTMDCVISDYHEGIRHSPTQEVHNKHTHTDTNTHASACKYRVILYFSQRDTPQTHEIFKLTHIRGTLGPPLIHLWSPYIKLSHSGKCQTLSLPHMTTEACE